MGGLDRFDPSCFLFVFLSYSERRDWNERGRGSEWNDGKSPTVKY